MNMTHNDLTCTKYNEPVLPDGNGNCSLCGARISSKNGFEITSLNWEDLEGRFTPGEIAKLTSADMEWVASQMADAYLDGQYWNDLEYFVKEILDEKD
jgi:hypothetical protein